MESPFLYLTLCSMRNRLRVRLGRLREPRYLIGSVVGIAYFVMIFWRPFMGRRRYGPAGTRPDGPGGMLDVLGTSLAGQFGAACLVFVTIALAWVWPSSRRPALAFTRADVQFLFTAPIPRWRLIRYKILRSQLGAFFGSALVTLLMRPASMIQGWTFFIGVALIMATINLHLTGISLTRVPASQPGLRGLVRRWLPRAIVLAVVGVIARDLVVHWSEVAAAQASGVNVMSEVARITASGLSGVVLWPFRALVRLPLADSAAAFAVALPWTLLALGLNYVWVLRTDVPFEEASAELSEKLARVRTEGLTALREPRSVATPFRLAPGGTPEAAILWKNLISMGRFVSWRTFLRFAPILIVLVAMLTRGGSASGSHARMDVLAAVSLMIAAFAVLLGPQLARADLRQDLPNLAVLRTWPLRGATLVRGEVLAPAIVLVAIAWVALPAAAVFSMYGPADRQVGSLWALLAAAMAVTPGVILVQLLVQNALAVTFPSWVTVGPPRGGVDVMGQRMLLMVVSVLALVVALLPAVILAGSLVFIVRTFTGGFAIVLPGLVAAVVLLGEALLGSEIIGRILDRTDVSALDPADA
jgi:ABC-2 type transport system permease protein